MSQSIAGAALETHESKTLFSQALELLSRNKTETAMKRIEEALEISPNNGVYLSHYGLCVATVKHDHEVALDLCERAAKLVPDNPVVRVNLGKVHRMRGNNVRAYETFIRAWRTDKTHPAAATELSRMGIRRPPVLTFLPRSHWLNRRLGMLRAKLSRGMRPSF